MDPLTIASLLSGATTLAGLFGGGNKDAFEELLKRLTALTSPEAIGRDARGFETQILGSAGFSQAMRGAAAGANRLSQTINQSLASRGLSNTGVGAVTSPLARTAGSFQLGNLRASASQQAFELARAMAAARMSGLGGQLPGQSSRDLFGGGLQGLFDILKLMANKTGGGGGGNTSAAFVDFLNKAGWS